MYEIVIRRKYETVDGKEKEILPSDIFCRKKEVRVHIDGNPNEIRHDVRCPVDNMIVRRYIPKEERGVV
jgi:hypothetical protein